MSDWSRDLRTRLAGLALGAAREAEIVDELCQHLDDRFEELRAGGVSDADARRLALAELDRDGGLGPRMRGLAQAHTPPPVPIGAAGRGWRSGAWQDVRYGLRTLRRHPGFTAVALLTLALGIGVNAGIFTVVNAVLFRGLAAPDADRLVSISQAVRGVPARLGQEAFPTSDYLAYRDRAKTLSGVAAYGNVLGDSTLGGNTPRKILGSLVSCNFFDVLQQPPALGRALTQDDCNPGADLVVMLSHELWETAFAADPGIVGRAIQLNRQRVTVAGVAAPGTFNGSSILRGGYFAPLTAGRLLVAADTRYDDEQSLWLTLLARERDDAGVEAVRAELDVIAAQIDRRRPGRSTLLTIERARPTLPRQLRDRAPGAAVVLMAAFGFILLIACANVANLLLARGTSRSREIGIRVALGASRARVVRQLLTESLLLALAGGVLGSVIAVWSFQALIALAVPALLPPWLPLTLSVDVGPDLRVLAFAAALTFGTGVLFGLAPAVYGSRTDLQVVMKQDTAGAGGSRRGGRVRGTLVGGQVALCMVLMIAAGLVLRGLHATYTTDPGFAYRNVAYVSLESAFDGYGEAAADAMRGRLIAGLLALPGVDAVASADHEPLGDDQASVTFRRPDESENRSRVGELTSVSAAYFSALELPIVRGRPFTEAEVRDRAITPRPAILSATTARRLWPDADPLGRTLLSDHGPLQIVGVAADAQVSALGRIDPYYVYVPGEGPSVFVRSQTDVGATVSAIHALIRTLDPMLIVSVLPLEATLGWSRGISGTVTTLFVGLGSLALVLASVGIYGVVSYAVTGRYREIGIRLALGATARNVLGLMLRSAMTPVVTGAAVGIAAASVFSQLLSSVLFGVSAADPIGLGGAAILVLAVALTAGILAARPATRADPTATLRYE